MDTRKLDSFLETMPSRGLPTVDLAVAIDGEIVYRKTVGREAPDKNINYVCSISKITTCVAAMRLVEEGRLGLDDPVAKYLPAFQNLTVKQKDGTVKPAERAMTIRHLFTMTGGLNYNLRTTPMLRALAKPKPTTLSVVNSIAESPLDFEPGSKFQYSLCHDVLAAVVEVITGIRFAEYVQKNILDPLEMNDTGYHLPEALKPRMEKQYRYVHGARNCLEVEPRCPYVLTPDYDSGGAGLYSTTDDQIKLLKTLSCGGKAENGYQLLRPETVAMMEVDQLPEEARKYFMPNRLFGYSWGLCGRVHVNPTVSCARSSVGEFGWDGATGPLALVDRKKKLALYLGTHVYDCSYLYYQIHPKVRDLVYETFFPEKE